MAGSIHVGIGGWTFEPWRGVFYPADLPKTKELAYAAERLTAIEVNGTFYSSQKPETFRKWAAEAPQGFRFALKAPRYATNRRVLAEAGDSITRFFESGPTEMGDKLGPILWQFAATKRFDREDLAAFLKLLPAKHDGRTIRHAIEAGHESFADPAFVTLLREADAEVTQVVLDAPDHPAIPDASAGFVYLRLQRSEAEVATGYEKTDLDAWAERLKTYASGSVPNDLPTIAGKTPASKQRDVYAFFISGAKERNPAAAMAMIERV